MKKLSKVRAAAILSAAIFSVALPFAAQAATATSDLGVSASVSQICEISTSPVGFGAYNPVTTANLDFNGSVTVTCSAGATGLSIGLGLGANADGTTRRMVAGASQFLTYELYKETGRTTVWGTVVGTTALTVADGTGVAQTYTVFGRVPSGQTAAVVGTYADTVVATINF